MVQGRHLRHPRRAPCRTRPARQPGHRHRAGQRGSGIGPGVSQGADAGGHDRADRALGLRSQVPAVRNRQQRGRERHAHGERPGRLRPRRERPPDAAAHHVPGQGPQRGGQLLQPRQRGRQRRGARGGAAPAARGAGRPVSVPEAEPRRRHRQRRPDRHSARTRPDGLGGRARGGGRPDGQVRLGERRPGLHLRLPGVDRRLRPRRPAAGRQRHAVRLVRRQGARLVCAPGAVDCAEGVLRRPDGESAADAECRRPDAAGRARGRHDPLAVGNRRVRLVDHHPLSG